jgi:hypothetical protein
MKRFGRRGADRWRRSELAGHSEVSVASNSRSDRAAVVFIVRGCLRITTLPRTECSDSPWRR